MARPPRIHAAGMWFHVFNRGADRQDLYHDDADHLAFEELAAGAVDSFRFEIHAWCQMTNHFHGLVRCHDDVLSDVLHRVCTVYAVRYNHRHERTGPLFDGRFRSIPILDEAHLDQTSRYIHRNPIPIVGVRALAAYRWSSFGPYVGTRERPTWLTVSHVVERFADPSAYRTFVETSQPSDQVSGWAAPHPGPEPDAVERAVAAVSGVAVSTLFESRRAVANHPRLIAILLLLERRVATPREIAARYHMASPTSARTAARRARVLRSSDAGFQSLWERAAEALGNRTNGV